MLFTAKRLCLKSRVRGEFFNLDYSRLAVRRAEVVWLRSSTTSTSDFMRFRADHPLTPVNLPLLSWGQELGMHKVPPLGMDWTRAATAW
jgi:hypothetical protein